MTRPAQRDIPQIPVAPILEALGFENVPHVRSGYAKVACFFHGDRRPSASVSRYGFTCFSCGRRGDAIKLLQEEEGLDFKTALERAAELAGITTTDVAGEPANGWGSADLFA